MIEINGTFSLQLPVLDPKQSSGAALAALVAQNIGAGIAALTISDPVYSIACLDGTTAQVTGSVFATYAAALNAATTPTPPV